MEVIIGDEVHDVYHYDGGWVDTRCNRRIFGTSGREYQIVHQAEVTCQTCVKSDKE